ncbi:hypothetical protein [Roseiconus lacunae]|uniref:hypothetical protein n=1 Tax=Roseiconus lacunae TaxID=2605694 RepID=UPI001E593BCF|nr:hypothetical protein [Roseiconus lacunae]MCD0462089.1 hypothetical protein [Roseiconus lacunae]
MSNDSKNPTNRPSLYAYQVRETGNGKSFWNRIGAAWENKDGGFTIQLDCVPLDGRIVCQTPKQQEA